MKPATDEEKKAVEALLALCSDYLVDLAVLAILKVHAIEAQTGFSFKAAIDAVEERLTNDGRELVAAIAAKMRE